MCVGGGWGDGKACYNSMVRSQSFSEPVPLNCELHILFCFRSLLYGEWESRRKLVLHIFLPLGLLGSGRVVSLEGSPR